MKEQLKNHHVPVYAMEMLDKLFVKIIFQLFCRNQYTRLNVLKAIVRGIDNEWLRQIPN